MLRVPAAIIVVALATGCGPLSPTTPPSPDERAPADPVPARAVDRDQQFVLVISTPRTVYQVGEPIEIGATLTYVGPLAKVGLAGSGSGLVGFGLDELDGDRDQVPSWTGDCARYELARNVPLTIPFTKSGAFDPEAPEAAFWRAFFSDPVLRLPAGRWRISGIAQFNTPATCPGREHSLRASIEVVVVP